MKRTTSSHSKKRKTTKAKASVKKQTKRVAASPRATLNTPKKKSLVKNVVKASVRPAKSVAKVPTKNVAPAVKVTAKKPAVKMIKKQAPVQKISPAKTPTQKTAEDRAIEEILKRVEAINAARLISFKSQEITRPVKIERMLPKKPESHWNFDAIKETPKITPVQNMDSQLENREAEFGKNETLEMESETNVATSDTVMIRSVSPLHTPKINSSAPYVEQTPKVTFNFARALSVAAVFVLVIAVASAGVFKLGTSAARVVAQRENAPRVAGAETGTQTFTFNDQFVFVYPTNWTAIQKGNTLTLTDATEATNQKASVVELTSTALGSKSFQQWLASQKQFAGKTPQRVENTNVLSYQFVNKDGSLSQTYAFLVGTSNVVVVNLKQESSVAARTVFNQVIQSLRFL